MLWGTLESSIDVLLLVVQASVSSGTVPGQEQVTREQCHMIFPYLNYSIPFQKFIPLLSPTPEHCLSLGLLRRSLSSERPE